MRFLILAFLFSCSSLPVSDLQVVNKVDLEKYQGEWFEIAKFENEFQKDCLGTRATYTLDGKSLSVLNECKTISGDTKFAKGKAFVVDEGSNAKLKVSFVPLLKEFGLFSGDYWIIDLDENYEYVVVGHPEREYLWILSRNKTMEEIKYRKILDRLKSKYKYDIDRILKSPSWVD